MIMPTFWLKKQNSMGLIVIDKGLNKLTNLFEQESCFSHFISGSNVLWRNLMGITLFKYDNQMLKQKAASKEHTHFSEDILISRII